MMITTMNGDVTFEAADHEAAALLAEYPMVRAHLQLVTQTIGDAFPLRTTALISEREKLFPDDRDCLAARTVYSFSIQPAGEEGRSSITSELPRISRSIADDWRSLLPSSEPFIGVILHPKGAE